MRGDALIPAVLELLESSCVVDVSTAHPCLASTVVRIRLLSVTKGQPRVFHLVSVQTVDFFRASVTDPWLFGRVAAEHALGDCYAMGAAPAAALAIAVVPYAAEAQVHCLSVLCLCCLVCLHQLEHMLRTCYTMGVAPAAGKCGRSPRHQGAGAF